MKRLFFLATALLCASCFSYDLNEKPIKTLYVGGSTSVSELIEKISPNYTKQTGNKIQIRELGSKKGLYAVSKGIVDIGFMSRYMNKEEVALNPNLKQITIAYDAIAIMVNSANKLDNLSKQQVASIYAGETVYWSELHEQNPHQKIISLSKGIGHGTLDIFSQTLSIEYLTTTTDDELHFRRKNDHTLYRYAQQVITFRTYNQAMGFIERTPTAIGYDSYGAISKLMGNKKTSNIKVIALDNEKPFSGGKYNERYPMQRPLVLIYDKSSTHPLINQLVTFLKNNQTKQIITAAGYFPI